MNILNRRNPERQAPRSTGGRYEIVVEAKLGPRWAGWFEGFDIVGGDGGTTRLIGLVADQAALHAALSRIRDLGVPLVSVRRVDGATLDEGLEH